MGYWKRVVEKYQMYSLIDCLWRIVLRIVFIFPDNGIIYCFFLLLILIFTFQLKRINSNILKAVMFLNLGC
jgi:hypothetical protein